MYNLLVTSDPSAWEGTSPIYRYAADRFLAGSTRPHVVARFKELREETIAELCALPTLFTYELDVNKAARLGKITNIAQSYGGGVSLTFQLDSAVRPIARDEILAIQVALGVSDPAELNRTHWVVKEADLVRALRSLSPPIAALEQRPSIAETNRYELVARLGAGGQALVCRATDLLLNRPVAIKSLEPFFDVAPDDRDRERLKREARALATLSHSSIPAVYDIHLDTSPPRIIFEFIDGANLLSVLNARRPTLREVCRWMRQVCGALTHAHERGVIHRDVKPSNIVLRTREGSCCLVDFGFAAISGEALRSSSRLAGTPAYMSPEQLRGEELDARADVYSLAVTMYQLVANKLPAPERYEPLSLIDNTIPSAVDDLIRECLGAKLRRPATADEFARRLTDAVAVSLSMSEVLEHGRLLQRVIESLEKVSPDNLLTVIDDVKALRVRLVRLQSLVQDGQVSLRDLGVDAGTSIDTVIIPLEDAVKKFRRQYLIEALEKFRGNRTQTARALGVNVRTVFRYLEHADDVPEEGQ